MSRVPRHLGLVLALSVFAAPTPVLAQDVEGLFNEAISLLSQGKDEEALAAFQRLLAADPSNADAFALWMDADRQARRKNQDALLDMLVMGGEYEKAAKRFLERTKQGRMELERDSAQIRERVSTYLATADSAERRKALNEINANHGEFAVPYMIRPLADESNDEERVRAMAGLSQLGTDVVLPLVESLNSDSAFQRRNVALVLGRIADPRAGAMLLHVAGSDEDLTTQAAAMEAATKCGASGSAADLFLRHGDDYHHRRDTVLRDVDYSDVVWSWEGGELVPADVPRAIYNNELAKRCYYRALASSPDNVEALAGIARENVDIHGKLTAMAEAGADVDGLLEQAAAGKLAVNAAGEAAIDRALVWSVQADDTATGARLCGALAEMATQPTEGLRLALNSGSAGLAGEAAVALAHIASNSNSAVDGSVVGVLADAVAREAMLVTVIIDGDAGRAQSLISALAGRGVMSQHVASGAIGVATVSQLPGVDAVLVSETLPDITADSVISALQSRSSFGETPVFLISSDEELVDAYGDRIAGSLADADGIDALDDVFSAGLTGDRAEADALSGRAAAALGALAADGRSQLGAAAAALAGAAGRADHVAIPALAALGRVGGAGDAAAALATLADDSRSDESRAAAADAIGAIAARTSVPAEVAEGVRAIVSGDGSLDVRAAAARALGRMNLGGEDRAGLLEAIRVRVNGE